MDHVLYARLRDAPTLFKLNKCVIHMVESYIEKSKYVALKDVRIKFGIMVYVLLMGHGLNMQDVASRDVTNTVQKVVKMVFVQSIYQWNQRNSAVMKDVPCAETSAS